MKNFFLLLSITLSIHCHSQEQLVSITYKQIINDSKDNWGYIDASLIKVNSKDSVSLVYSKKLDTTLISKQGELVEFESGSSNHYRLSMIKDICKNIVSYQKGNGREYVSVVDTLVFDYKYGNKTKTILGYECRQAFLKFRGRFYELYYSTELPTSSGPFKFMGLPGMILEINSTDQTIYIVAAKIENVLSPKDNDLRPFIKKFENPVSYNQFRTDYLENINARIKKTESKYSNVTSYIPKRFIEIY